MLRKFFELNRIASMRTAALLRQKRSPIFSLYNDTAVRLMKAGDVHTVADVGGGNHCPLSKERTPEDQIKIVAVDVSAEAMEGNQDVDDKRVANIVDEGLPFEPGEVDLLVSRSVLEHLHDVERFVANSNEVLRPGGRSVHLFSSRWSLFAILNRILPERVARRVLFTVRPWALSWGGFKTYYDKCYHSAIKKVFERQGFEIEEVVVVYRSASYYAFLFPLFVLMAIYEAIVRVLGLKNLGSHVLLVARKL